MTEYRRHRGRRMNNMSSSLLLIILFSCFLILQTHGVKDYYLLIERCSNTANYTSNSQFQRNLNILLPSLVENGSRDGFFNTTVGASPDTVYGLVQCRGDLSMKNCRSCLKNSTVEILLRCPNRKEAGLRYDLCVIRYSNLRFFSQVDNTFASSYYITRISDEDADRFDQQLGTLMNNLSTTAASRPSRYNSGTIGYTGFSPIYGMVQCTEDLLPNDCLSCLTGTISWIPDCCNRSEGALIGSLTCTIEFELYSFLEIQSPSPPPQVEASPTQSTTNNTKANTEEVDGKGKSTNIVVIIIPTIASVLLLAICVFFITRRVRRNGRTSKAELIYDRDDMRSEESLQFDLNTIRIATNDFSDENKLGEGGFGAVYKGELLDGQDIAVKRLSSNSGQGSQEFKNEVVLLHKLQHRNLVRLLGFCLSGKEKLLIYEYVPNRSLDKYIFDPAKKSYLNWEKRCKIIGGIARGLLYLHEDARLRVIHRDLKAGNILLDNDMNAKIADFGMAKLFGVDETHGNTNIIAGTYGYMAPEYAIYGLFSVKSDVYSFGILILEIVSGQKTNNFRGEGCSRDLLSHAWKLWSEGNALQLLDPILSDNCSTSEVMRCIHIGFLCVQDNLDDRPTMSSIVLMLDNYPPTLQPPSAPSLILESMTGETDPSRKMKSNDYTSSIATVDGASFEMTLPR